MGRWLRYLAGEWGGTKTGEEKGEEELFGTTVGSVRGRKGGGEGRPHKSLSAYCYDRREGEREGGRGGRRGGGREGVK
jgi:hypothetical protein